MGKLRLSLDSLEVTSFETHAAPRDEAGTVRAHADSEVDCPSAPPQQCITTEPFTGWECTGPICGYTLAITCAGGCQSSEEYVCGVEP